MKFPQLPRFGGKARAISSNALAKKAAHILAGGAYREADVLAVCGSVVAQSEPDKKNKRAPTKKRRA